MTAFLFIPSTIGSPVVRRVDLQNIASLFGGDDEFVTRLEPRRGKLLDTVLAILTAIAVIGDIMLVVHPERVAADVATPQSIFGLEHASGRPPHQVLSAAGAI